MRPDSPLATVPTPPRVARCAGSTRAGTPGAPPGRTGALLSAALLAGYGNLFTAVVWHTQGVAFTVLSLAGPLALLAAVLGWHRGREGRPLAELGLHGRRWRTGLGWGVAGGLLLAAPPLLALALLPLVTGSALRVAGVQGASTELLLLRLLVFTPLLVALVEEVVFRGFLLGRLRRAIPGGPLPALLLSAVAFALWHVTVNLLTLGSTNVTSAGLASLPLALLGGLLGVFVAALVFGALYLRTGTLAAPFRAHWLVNALLLLALGVP